jgi:hypothetical protein
MERVVWSFLAVVVGIEMKAAGPEAKVRERRKLAG